MVVRIESVSVEFDSDSHRQVQETQRRPSSVKWEGPVEEKSCKGKDGGTLGMERGFQREGMHGQGTRSGQR